MWQEIHFTIEEKIYSIEYLDVKLIYETTKRNIIVYRKLTANQNIISYYAYILLPYILAVLNTYINKAMFTCIHQHILLVCIGFVYFHCHRWHWMFVRLVYDWLIWNTHSYVSGISIFCFQMHVNKAYDGMKLYSYICICFSFPAYLFICFT